jgi:hypothetical protein
MAHISQERRLGAIRGLSGKRRLIGGERFGRETARALGFLVSKINSMLSALTLEQDGEI